MHSAGLVLICIACVIGPISLFVVFHNSRKLKKLRCSECFEVAKCLSCGGCLICLSTCASPFPLPAAREELFTEGEYR